MFTFKTFIGIPTVRRDESFWESMDSFIPALKEECEVEVCIVKNKTIAEARNEIASRFLDSDADFLLFLDDDHSGHTIEMFDAILDPLVNNNAYMCGIKCYTKVFPYCSNILIYSGADEKKLGLQEGSGKYMPIDLDNGYMYVDLVGFGMTLLSRKAFSIIEPPYFFSQDVNGRSCREDNYFCDKLNKMGIKPVGCFKYTLTHNGIDGVMVRQLRDEGMNRLREKFPDMKVLVS